VTWQVCPNCGGSGEVWSEATPKRRNHQGSVYQRTADGRWCASLMVEGERRISYARSEGEAWEKLRKLRRQYRLPPLQPPTE